MWIRMAALTRRDENVGMTILSVQKHPNSEFSRVLRHFSHDWVPSPACIVFSFAFELRAFVHNDLATFPVVLRIFLFTRET